MPLTGFYAALCAFLILVLALQVIVLRWRTKTGLGDGGDRRLGRAICIHGNAVEYIPLALILMLIAELGHANVTLLHGCGIALIGGRIAHALGLVRTAGASIGRSLGVTATFAVIVTLAAIDVAAFLCLRGRARPISARTSRSIRRAPYAETC